MLGAILHLSVATHYCGGKVTESRVSLTSELGGCGMEDSEKKSPLPGFNFTAHCCDDIVTLFGVDSNYTSSSSFIPESHQYNFQVLAIPVELSAKSQTDQNLLYTNVSPPGVLMSTKVDLSDICVFRI